MLVMIDSEVHAGLADTAQLVCPVCAQQGRTVVVVMQRSDRVHLGACKVCLTDLELVDRGKVERLTTATAAEVLAVPHYCSETVDKWTLYDPENLEPDAPALEVVGLHRVKRIRESRPGQHYYLHTVLEQRHEGCCSKCGRSWVTMSMTSYLD